MRRSSIHLFTVLGCLLAIATVVAAPATQTGQGVVTGLVTDASTGTPIAAVSVTVSSSGLAVMTDGAGIYRATVPAGTYVLTVQAQNHPAQSAFGVVVRNGGTVTVNFLLSRPVAAAGFGTLTGTVRDASASPTVGIANATVSVSPGGQTATTGPGGRYALSLPAGTYTVSVSAAFYRPASIVGVVITSRTVTARDLQLAPTQRDFEFLHVFASPAEGANPATLIQATDGDLYGTTATGGEQGCGTIFKMTPAGAFTVLHYFTCGADGGGPAGLVQGTDGNFYGTTSTDYGTVFKMTPEGTVNVLHTFRGLDGTYPGSLTEGTDGNLYGTTSNGGAFDWGTAFRITPDGVVSVLHAFSRGADGANPNGDLIQATDGNFYGTTYTGGSSDRGTVFTMTPDGTVTGLHSFTGGPDGAFPLVGVIQGSDGNLYGTTWRGGTSDWGTVFRMTPAGDVTILHPFLYDESMYPSRLFQATDGNLYGTVFGDDTVGGGYIYGMTPAGAMTILHWFDWFGSIGGSAPGGGVVQGTDGDFYGTTVWGGVPNQTGSGTLFRLRILTAPLPSPIESVPDRRNESRIVGGSAAHSLTEPTARVAAPRHSAVATKETRPAAPDLRLTGSVRGVRTNAPVFHLRLSKPNARGRVFDAFVGPARARGAQTSTWEIEAFGGATFGSRPSRGTGTLPPAGIPFVTATGALSRSVSSWYFGDGAQLLNGMTAALDRSQSITPLDAALGASLVEHSSGGGGVRVGRILTPRLTAEVTVEFASIRAGLSSDASAAIEASRASFLSAWEAVASAGHFEDAAVTSVRAVRIDNGRQVVATGAINVERKIRGKVIPYLTVGAGLSGSSRTSVSASLVGDYRFLVGGITPFHETDSVVVRYTVGGHIAVGVLGGGFKYLVSPRFGWRVDYRTYLSSDQSATFVASTPVVSTLTPAGSAASATTPGLQFSNDASLGIRSSLSGPTIADFRTFAPSGLRHHTRLTVGLFWRF